MEMPGWRWMLLVLLLGGPGFGDHPNVLPVNGEYLHKQPRSEFDKVGVSRSFFPAKLRQENSWGFSNPCTYYFFPSLGGTTAQAPFKTGGPAPITITEGFRSERCL
jgi:hypothetical protein